MFCWGTALESRQSLNEKEEWSLSVGDARPLLALCGLTSVVNFILCSSGGLWDLKDYREITREISFCTRIYSEKKIKPCSFCIRDHSRKK